MRIRVEDSTCAAGGGYGHTVVVGRFAGMQGQLPFWMRCGAAVLGCLSVAISPRCYCLEYLGRVATDIVIFTLTQETGG